MIIIITKVTIIPIVIGALGTVMEGLVLGPEDLEITGRAETIQTIVLFRSARILRRVLETWGDFCHSNSSENPSANAGVKNSQKRTNNNNNNNNWYNSYLLLPQIEW